MNNVGFCEFPHGLAQVRVGFLGQFLKALLTRISHPCRNFPNIPCLPTCHLREKGQDHILGPQLELGALFYHWSPKPFQFFPPLWEQSSATKIVNHRNNDILASQRSKLEGHLSVQRPLDLRVDRQNGHAFCGQYTITAHMEMTCWCIVPISLSYLRGRRSSQKFPLSSSKLHSVFL